MNRTSLEAYHDKLVLLEADIANELADLQMQVDFAEIEATAAATLGPRRQHVLDAMGIWSPAIDENDTLRLTTLQGQLNAIHAYQLWIDEQIAALPA